MFSIDEAPRWDVRAAIRRRDVNALIWKARRHTVARGDVDCLRRLLPDARVDEATVERLLAELRESPELRAALATPEARVWAARADGPTALDLEGRLALDGHGRGRAILLYAAIRLARPRVVVETGCFTGWDSAVILQALDRNGEGRLHTIDLPARTGEFSQIGACSGLPPELGPGFFVPESFRQSWSLTLGETRRELVPLLEELGTVDFFFHDAHHSFSSMIWEYAAVWPRLQPGSILASDDIAWNTAFSDFARGIGRRVVVHSATPNVGALRC